MTKQQKKELQEATDKYLHKYFTCAAGDYCKVIDVGFDTDENSIRVEYIAVNERDIFHSWLKPGTFHSLYLQRDYCEVAFMKAYEEIAESVKSQAAVINKYGSKI